MATIVKKMSSVSPPQLKGEDLVFGLFMLCVVYPMKNENLNVEEIKRRLTDRKYQMYLLSKITSSSLSRAITKKKFVRELTQAGINVLIEKYLLKYSEAPLSEYKENFVYHFVGALATNLVMEKSGKDKVIV